MNTAYSSSFIYQFFLAMKTEVDRHKWIESEKAGHDVGIEFALIDWALRHKSNWKLHYMESQHSTSSMRKNG
jgi:hypothetical protein